MMVELNGCIFIEDDDDFIWDKVSTDIKKDFVVNLFTIKIFWKAK